MKRVTSRGPAWASILCLIVLAILDTCHSDGTIEVPGFVVTPFERDGALLSRRREHHQPRRGTSRVNVWPFGGGGADNKSPPKDGKQASSSKAGPCKVCSSRGYTDCAVCKGTGIDKKDGNPFERFKCKKCQGFGLINCSACNPTGLTPEQRGER